MIAGSDFVNIFGITAPGDPENTSRVALAAVRAGFAIVACRPGQKVPMCILNARAAKAADREAQAAAKEAGNPRWSRIRHPCGLEHAITDPAVAQRAIPRLIRDHGPVNLGVELGRSRMLVVDVDTAAEKAAFLADWGAATGADETGRTPTVLSPGAVNSGGTWVHKDGGHYWFSLPEGVELPAGTGVLKAPSGWVAMWSAHQVLIPPSVRPEGPYRLTGQCEPAPAWITDMVIQGVVARQVRGSANLDHALDSGNDIERWSATTPWGELLGVDGWTDTGLVDTCSCPIWTAPGYHASSKSATAHDIGCARYDTATGWGPLHVWTDNPPEYMTGRKTFTKVQYLAARDHEGSDAGALQALGMISSRTDAEFPGFDLGTVADLPVPAAAKEAGPKDPFDCAGSPDEAESTGVDDAVDEDDPVALLLAKMLTSEQLDTIEDPEPLVSGVLDLDTIARMTGKSNHGKTFVSIDLACSVATGKPWHGRPVAQGMVVYLVAEGARGFKKRIRAWESRYLDGEFIAPSALRVIPFPIQATDATAWRTLRLALQRLSPALVIMDTQARITVGVNENDATEMGIFVERVEQIRRETGACVMLVHHLGHHGEQGRGSSAVIGAMNTELRVVKDSGKILVYNDKQKDEAQFEPIAFVLESEGASAVLVGGDTDPFTSTDVGPDSPTWDRMLKIIYGTAPLLGLTKAEARKTTLAVDKGSDGHPMAERTFLRTWDRCVANGSLAQVVDAEGKTTTRYVVTPDRVEALGLAKT